MGPKSLKIRKSVKKTKEPLIFRKFLKITKTPREARENFENNKNSHVNFRVLKKTRTRAKKITKNEKKQELARSAGIFLKITKNPAREAREKFWGLFLY